MLSRAELARLWKVRRYLIHTRGVGAAAARWQLDNWIVDEVAAQERMREYPPLRPTAPPKPPQSTDPGVPIREGGRIAPRPSRPQIMEKGVR